MLVCAVSGKTPKVTPVVHSAIVRAQGGESREFLGTPERLSSLRDDCLTRDRHRCVISRGFDIHEAQKRIAKNGDDAVDDDNHPLNTDSNKLVRLEVAHILPHSLTRMVSGTDGSLSLVCLPLVVMSRPTRTKC